MAIKPDYPNERCEARVWISKWRHYEQCKNAATDATASLCKTHARRNGKGWNGRDVKESR